MVAKVSTRSGRIATAAISDINVTPFVDVMLVLLIIFMVALPVATVALKLDLPPPRAAAGAAPLVISIRTDGRLFIGDRATSLATLGADMRTSLAEGQKVYVRADRGVRYGGFVAVIDTLREAGYDDVGLVSEQLS